MPGIISRLDSAQVVWACNRTGAKGETSSSARTPGDSPVVVRSGSPCHGAERAMFRVSSEEHPPGIIGDPLRAQLDLCTADGQQETVDHSGHTRSLGQETEQPEEGRVWENELFVQDRINRMFNRTFAVMWCKSIILLNRSQPQSTANAPHGGDGNMAEIGSYAG